MRFLLSLIALLAVNSSQAMLLGRMPTTSGGTDFQAYYDDVLAITWLADANLPATYNFGLSRDNYYQYLEGTLWWSAARSWIDRMNAANYLGASQWRLPTIRPINGSAWAPANSFDGSTDLGYNISAPNSAYPGAKASEMAHLFYNTLGNAGAFTVSGTLSGCYDQNPLAPYCLTNSGPFVNLRSNNGYWTDTFLPPYGSSVVTFYFLNGGQGLTDNGNGMYVWAVHDGDPFAVVPIPASVWLLAWALAALSGNRWRVRTFPPARKAC